MAEDTRKPSPPSPPTPSPPSTRSPTDPIPDSEAPWRDRVKDIPKGQLGKLWEEFGNPADPANEMPGGTYNSAGGKPKEVTWKDALTIKKSDFTGFYKLGCSRDALLVGLVVGAGVGGFTGVIGGMKLAWRATNLGVAGFVAAALGQYTWCESRRREEGRNMAMAVVGMRRLEEKKKAEAEAEKLREAAEEAERAAQRKEERKARGWGLW